MKPGGIRPVRKIKYGDNEAKTKNGGLDGLGVVDHSKILNGREIDSNQVRSKSRQRNDVKSQNRGGREDNQQAEVELN